MLKQWQMLSSWQEPDKVKRKFGCFMDSSESRISYDEEADDDDSYGGSLGEEFGTITVEGIAPKSESRRA